MSSEISLSGESLAWVLIVDDEPTIRVSLTGLLKSDHYQVEAVSSALEAIEVFREHEIAVLLADQSMPGMTGLDLINLIKQQCPTTVIIMMTATEDMKMAAEILNHRLVEFLVTKPFNVPELRKMVDRAIDSHQRLKQNLASAYTDAAGQFVHEHAARAAFALARAVDARDSYTHKHSERVAAMARAVGRALGLDQEILEELRIGGLLHDVGKIGIPDEVLLKPGDLSEEDNRYIRMHPVIGVTITEPLKFPLRIDAIVRQHHENYDGSGYPTGIAGEGIELTARIVRVVDSYEAMSSDRVYRRALPTNSIEKEVLRCRESEFDPRVTDIFLELLRAKQLVQL